MNAPEALPTAHAAELLPLAAICLSRTNPRKHFDKERLAELTDSVRRHGVLQPVLVRPKPDPAPLNDVGDRLAAAYELVAGERRYRAARAAGLETLPAMIRELSDAEALELQVVENLQRQDLHELEEAEGYETLLKRTDASSGKPYDVETIAAKVGKSRAYVYARLKLTALDPKAREAFYAGKLNASTALLLARIPTRPLQLEALKEITAARWGREAMSFREAAEHVREKYMLRLPDAPFDTKDAKLLPTAGACTDCPKRTGNQPELFSDIQSGDVCTDPGCFSEKKGVHLRLQREDAVAKGRTVITGDKAKKLLPYQHSDSPADGYVRPADRCFHDEKNRTYAQLLGKDAPEPLLVESPRSGELVPLLALAKITETLKRKGVGAKQSRSAGDKAREGKARLEVKIRSAIFEAVHAAHSGQLSTADGALVAREFFQSTGHEFRKRIVNLWMPPEASPPAKDKTPSKMDQDYRRQQAFEKRIATLDGAELARLLVDLAIVGDTAASVYSNRKPQNLLAAAERMGVDAAKIRRDLTAAVKPAKPPKAIAKPKAKRPAPSKKAVAEASA